MQFIFADFSTKAKHPELSANFLTPALGRTEVLHEILLAS
jgi:hypothetical protein